MNCCADLASAGVAISTGNPQGAAHYKDIHARETGPAKRLAGRVVETAALQPEDVEVSGATQSVSEPHWLTFVDFDEDGRPDLIGGHAELAAVSLSARV